MTSIRDNTESMRLLREDPGYEKWLDSLDLQRLKEIRRDVRHRIDELDKIQETKK